MSEGQKFIGRNRAPRVQIEYDVETGGAEKAVQLPFVMNVMSDLKGRYGEDEEAVDLAERSFENVDISTFGDYLRKTKPRATFRVKNKLGDGDEEMGVDLSFTSMKDFTPGKIAEQVPALKELLDARNELKSLLTFMDGRANAEKAIKELLNNETLMKSLATSEANASEEKSDG
ncbi:MAG: type VI secretion system contractile sheath small subunit [Pseudomonadota bacterium]